MNTPFRLLLLITIATCAGGVPAAAAPVGAAPRAKASAPGSAATTSSEGLAIRLAELRAEVEDLSEELRLAETQRRDQQASLRSRVLEMEADRDRERLRRIRLDDELSRLHARQTELAAEQSALKPVAAEIVDDLAAYVDGALPIRRAERLLALDDLRKSLREKTLTPEDVIVRCWAFAQDEQKLATSTGLFRQSIRIGEPAVHVDAIDEVLADIVHVGGAALFFETPDGRVGRSRKTQDQWWFETLDDPEQQEAIHDLVEAHRRSLATGLFALPLAPELQASALAPESKP